VREDVETCTGTRAGFKGTFDRVHRMAGPTSGLNEIRRMKPRKSLLINELFRSNREESQILVLVPETRHIKSYRY
jgi:hypothetical protein